MDEKLLKEALAATFNKVYDYPPADDIDDYTPSPEFEKKMDKLIKRQRKPYFPLICTTGRRVACVLVIVTALAVSTLSVDAVRNQFVQFFVNIFPTHNEINMNPAAMDNIDDLNKITPEYIEANLPEGFELVSSVEDDVTILKDYRRGDSYFLYYFTKEIDQHIFNDNEEVTYESYVDGNGKEYMIYESEEHTQFAIYWIEGDYLYKINTNLSKDEFFEIF